LYIIMRGKDTRNQRRKKMKREELMKKLDEEKEGLEVIKSRNYDVNERAKKILDEVLLGLKSFFKNIPLGITLTMSSSGIQFNLKEEGLERGKEIFYISLNRPFLQEGVAKPFLNYYTTMTDISDTFELIRLQALGEVARLIQETVLMSRILEGYQKYWKFEKDNYVSFYSVEKEIGELTEAINEIDFREKLVPGVIWESETPRAFDFSGTDRSGCYRIEIVTVNPKTVGIKYADGRYCGERFVTLRYDWMKIMFRQIRQLNDAVASKVIGKV